MKTVLVLVVVVLCIVAAGCLMQARYVTEHETITQLLWNREEALIFVGMRRDGWTGSYPGLARELARGVFGFPPRYGASRSWVFVVQVTPSGGQRHVEGGDFFDPQPFEGALFQVNGLRKWDGQRFVPASAEERARYHLRTRASSPNYSNVEGWSSRMNLLSQAELKTVVPLTLAGVTGRLIAERNADSTRKTIAFQFDGRQLIEILALREGPRLVTAGEYASLLK